MSTTVISPLLNRPGAVADSGPEAGVAAHYGDPMGEQRRLTAGEALVDLSHRAVIRVSGPDRLSWLNSMTTQQLAGLEPGISAETLVLSPRGHIEYAVHLVDDGESAWLTSEPGSGPSLAAWLHSMQFMLRVEVDEVSADFAVLGSASAALLPDSGVVWTDPWPGPVGDTACYGPIEEHPGASWSWIEAVLPRERLDQVDQPLAGSWALAAARVAAWRPRAGWETDHRTIPHELDWLRTAVHLHKGCYRGQETIARVHNLGRPPRRLVFLHLDGSEHELPEPGAALLAGDREVGRITTPARHQEQGPIALGVVKRSLPLDVALRAGTVAAAQSVIVQP